jgi:hypothetical protein
MKNGTHRKPHPKHSNKHSNAMRRVVAPAPEGSSDDESSDESEGSSDDESSDDESPASLGDLNHQIDSDPLLSSSPGVQQAQKNLNEQAKQNPSAFNQSGQVIDALNSGIAVWTNPNSSAEQIASSSLNVASKVLYATAAIPGVDIVTAPLGFLVGLIGAIVGVFGSHKKTNYYQALQKMIDDAVNQLESEQVDQDLAGALNTMQGQYWTICDILSLGAVPAGSPIAQDFGTESFTTAASQQLGEAFKNLEINLPYAKRDNWDNAAETYHSLATVLAFKVMYLMQGVSYFQLVDANTSDPGRRAQVLIDYINSLYARSSELGQAAIYMVRPDITHSVITQAIYRLSEDEFRSIGALMAYYIDDPNATGTKPWFWPTNATQYRFHAADGDMVRLSTWANRIKKDPRVLLGNETFADAGDAGYAGTQSHWMLWADTDAYSPQPYYRWYLQTADGGKTRGTFLFQVFPTADEIDEYNIADYDISNSQAPSLLFISSVGKDEVWHSSGKDTALHRDASFADIINGQDGKKNANKYLWVLLSESE